MFTNCPACARQFRVRATQLAQAEGLVQCGFCGKQFNALERLYDKPLIIDSESISTPTVEPNDDEPEFYIPQPESETLSEPAASTSAVEPHMDMTVDLPETGTDAIPESESPTVKHDAVADYPFPNELAEAEAPKAGLASRLFWSTGVLLLIMAGTVQAAWFNRDFLFSQYPQFLPQGKQICQYFNCTLIRYRNISAIKLLNRDVRIHPRYDDALLVNATMTNLSRYAQRFPQVLFSLYDTSGKVIAYRQVAPEDYLDDSIDIDQGMAPDAPVHFVLEIADTNIDAVSFEFDFL